MYRLAAGVSLAFGDLRAMSLWQFNQWVVGLRASGQIATATSAPSAQAFESADWSFGDR